MKPIHGFSKLSKEEKLAWLEHNIPASRDGVGAFLRSYWHRDQGVQEEFDQFSENTLSNFFLPLGVAPNFLINDSLYCVPMVIEESSVVAAASKSASYWLQRGGFKTRVVSTSKVGQVHLHWEGNPERLDALFHEAKPTLLAKLKPITENMEARGGGIRNIELLDFTDMETGSFQLHLTFETCDAHGANFINTVLEAIGKDFQEIVASAPGFSASERELIVIMAIVSNFTPACLVEAVAECKIEQLSTFPQEYDPHHFAWKFEKAVRIAKRDVFRATTHNKGIFNGIDAVVLATGNDFRAVEACGHAYAARDGQYRGLTDVVVDTDQDHFRFSLQLPIAIGTVGGLTSLHPMAKFSLNMLGNPNAPELMQIIATVGLAQNFQALKSLVTTGIQRGHMRMHLINILNQFEATKEEREIAHQLLGETTVSYSAVREIIADLRRRPAATE